jgi:hypothetical protein
MTQRALKLLFFGGAGAAFALSYSVADIASRIIVARRSFADAVGEHLEMALRPPFATLMLAAPFAALAWLGYRLGCRNAVKRGIALLFLPSVILAYFYFWGLYGSQEALLQRKWTAATLSVGLLPFFVGIPTVASAVALYFLVRPPAASSVRGGS